jgi:serine/threonine protein kinase
MSDRQPSPDLRALERNYEIVGELRGPPETHRFLAHRREDSAEVMITVARAPQDDDNNALAHLASDTQLLTNLTHTNVPRIHSGHWLGADSYAVISDPVHATPLAEFVSRGEKFANARVAVVLQEVDGVLDWARSQGIVHRKVTPETLWFEPGTDRVIVSFASSRIPISGIPDARGDARTIGVLAWTMLAGRRYDDRDDKANPPLAEANPDLATRVVEATEEMIRADSAGETPDVPAFLALVASGDVLRRAELLTAKRQSEFDEQHRIALEKYENQRTEIERAAAEQAERLVAERAAFERLVKERQEQLAAVRAELDNQRAEIARRLVILDKRRAAIEKMNEEVSQRAASAPVPQSIPDGDQPKDAHWSIPVSLAAILLLLIASLVATMSHQRRSTSSAGEVLAPRSAPFVRPAPVRTPAPIKRRAVIPDSTTPRLDTSTRDTSAHAPHTQ